MDEANSKQKVRLLKKSPSLSKVLSEDPSSQRSSAGFASSSAIPFLHRRTNSSNVSNPSRGRRATRKSPSQPDLKYTLPDIRELNHPETPELPPSYRANDPGTPTSDSFDRPLSVRSSVNADDQSVISVISFIPAPLSQDEIRRAKIAKLSRHLGENIPPELISDTIGCDSDTHTKSHSQEKARRRQSWGTTSSGSPLSFSVPAPKNVKNLARSRSMLVQRPHQHAASDESVDLLQRADRSFGRAASLSDRQRALHVKRARKMAQVSSVTASLCLQLTHFLYKVFGQEPPKELLQGASENRQTTEDTHSITSMSELLPSSTPIEQQSQSSSSSSTTLPGVAPSEEHDDIIELVHRSPDPPLINIPPPALSTTPDFTEPPSPTEPLSSATITFQERRRRAAKLSRFFGVGYQDISSSLRDVVPPPPTAHVDVKMAGRRFWSFDSRPDMQNVDMADAIDKLRGLKAN